MPEKKQHRAKQSGHHNQFRSNQAEINDRRRRGSPHLVHGSLPTWALTRSDANGEDGVGEIINYQGCQPGRRLNKAASIVNKLFPTPLSLHFKNGTGVVLPPSEWLFKFPGGCLFGAKLVA
ncbi:hypothetical protein NPIL_578461 [Nephila pilipes]|uniref:Uncharacterized protein n=1 Tax=Nephila pilipes TaxID=299642 RepID=A0A8X6P6F6_NEPPI|nr:hypothetical protein NPIL_578461 [Nephila pilipes]